MRLMQSVLVMRRVALFNLQSLWELVEMKIQIN